MAIGCDQSVIRLVGDRLYILCSRWPWWSFSVKEPGYERSSLHPCVAEIDSITLGGHALPGERDNQRPGFPRINLGSEPRLSWLGWSSGWNTPGYGILLLSDKMAIIAHRAPHLFSLSSRSNRDSGENNLIARSLDLKAFAIPPKSNLQF